MAGTPPTANTTLQIKKTYKASRETVFKAWTDPQTLKKWFGASDEYSTPVAEMDLRVGGKYRIQIKEPNGDTHTVVGTYREVRTPEKLVFTWAWEAGTGCGDEPIETLVTLEFRENGPETEVMLTHELFPDTETRDKHNEGWTGCLARLTKVV